MKTVLVTGASGFVGGEVVRQLLALGKEVTALDLVRPAENITFIQADLTDASGLQRALADEPFDVIMHLASLPGDTGNPTQMLQVNVNALQNLLEYARRIKVERFVLTSSISACQWYPATKYSPPDYLPIDEEHHCRPKDMYATTKRMQELLALTYYHEFGLPTTALRLTAVIGPHGKGGGRGWREFAEQLAEGKRVQVPYFSAEELCHNVDVRDVARMQIAVAEHPAAVGEVFNCCAPAPLRGSEFQEIVQRLVPGIEVEFGFPWSLAQGGELAFDMSKAKRLLGFEPLYTVEDSIKSIKDWIDAGGLAEEIPASDRAYGAGVVASEK